MQLGSASEAFNLLRRLLRTARSIPSFNHQRVALHRIRSEFVAARSASPEKQAETYLEGQVYLDTLEHQRDHLKTMQSENLLVQSLEYRPRRRPPVKSLESAGSAAGAGTK